MINFNRLFPWLSIRTKLIVAFAGLSIIPIAAVGVFAIISNVDSLILTAKKDLNNNVQIFRQRAGKFLSGVETDMRFLQDSYPVDQLVNELANRRSPNINRGLNLLAPEFLDFAKTKKIYYRVRIVNDEGAEVVRVESTSGIPDSDSFRIIPRAGLSHVKGFFYFLMTQPLKNGQIAFSPVELMRRDGKRVAVISFATPLYDETKRVGILIADVFAKDLFQVMEPEAGTKFGQEILLVSSDGHYLYDSRRKKNWDKLFVLMRDNIKKEYPSRISSEMLSGRTGIVASGIDKVVSYAPLFPEEAGMKGQELGSNFTIPLFVIEAIPKEILMKPVYSFTFAFAAAIAGFLVLSVMLGMFATEQFTRPIAEMRKGAEIISGGNYEHRLRIETRDEIEKLADQFNAMAAALSARDKELQNHKASLERSVAQRTRELFEEKSKLQTILDNVPSALLVLDRQLKIQTVSAAFGKVTGFQSEEVIGKDCRDLFCDAGLCHSCISQSVIQSGKAEGHLDQVVNANGTDRYLEHLAVPMEKDGKIGAILEIVTDVTKRKRLEQHLIKTEKLAAMGELTAFIAHEFRNSLTSIKMILQLFSESEELDRSKKESLTVALNSTYRMESTVTELLGFARPTLMDFKTTSVNEIVDDSIAFVRLRANKAKVTINKILAPSLPVLSLDVVHLRETMVNILLNAVQAIENRNFSFSSKTKNSQGDSVITVTTKKIRLRKTLRDYLYVEFGESLGESPVDLQEIVLEKGAECIEIEIGDTGPGIEETNLSRIFDPFFTTKPNGTGLGLSMAKRVVNGHGGIITVDSKLGIGTTFRIIIPLTHATLVAVVA